MPKSTKVTTATKKPAAKKPAKKTAAKKTVQKTVKRTQKKTKQTTKYSDDEFYSDDYSDDYSDNYSDDSGCEDEYECDDGVCVLVKKTAKSTKKAPVKKASATKKAATPKKTPAKSTKKSPAKKQKKQVDYDSEIDADTWDVLDAKRSAVFQCPISKKTLVDPVIADDGVTYSRLSIQKFLNTKLVEHMKAQGNSNIAKPFSVMGPSGKRINSLTLTPNLLVKEILKSL